MDPATRDHVRNWVTGRASLDLAALVRKCSGGPFGSDATPGAAAAHAFLEGIGSWGEPLRQSFLLAAFQHCAARGELGSFLPFLNAEMADFETGKFALRLREWFDHLRGHPHGVEPALDAVRRDAATAVAKLLELWASCQVEACDETGETRSDQESPLDAPAAPSDADVAWRVINGLGCFYVGRSVIETGNLLIGRGELQLGLARLVAGPWPAPADLHMACLSAWLRVLARKGEWAALRDIPKLYFETFRPDADPFGPDPTTADVGPREADLLVYWLLGATDDPDDPRIPTVARAVLQAWQDHRRPLSVLDRLRADHLYSWGPHLWVIEALASHLEERTPNERAGVAALLAHALEGFSSRMLLNPFATSEASDRVSASAPNATAEGGGPGGGTAAAHADAASADLPPIDPHPDLHPEGVTVRPFPKKRAAFGASQLSGPIVTSPPPTNGRSRAENLDERGAQFLDELTSPIGLGAMASHLPGDTAFLGCYDLPWSNRLVVVLALRLLDGRTFEVVECSSPGERFEPGGLSQKSFDEQIHGLWRNYEASTARGGPIDDRAAQLARAKLAQRIAVCRLHLHSNANALYGPVIDRAVEGIARLARAPIERLASVDLVVCPRGMAGTTTVELLGTAHPLLARFASVTVTPSLRVFDVLCQRAAGRAPVLQGEPVNLGVAGWEPLGNHPFAGNGVRSLFDQVLGRVDDPQNDRWRRVRVRLAAEQPLASGRRVARILAASDVAVVFGHGTPRGVRLFDGVFPPLLAHTGPAGDGAPTELYVACFGARWVQEAARADAFNPVINEFTLSRLVRSPGGRTTLIGGFTHEVHSALAARVVVDLVDRRLVSADADVRTGFAFARARRDRQLELLGKFSGDIANALKQAAERALAARRAISKGGDADRIDSQAKVDVDRVLELDADLSFRLIGLESRVD